MNDEKRVEAIESHLNTGKEKATTTYVASGWVAVQRFFRNMG